MSGEYIFIVAVNQSQLYCVLMLVCGSVCVSVWALSDQGHGHGVTLKFFSIYHNTNCQVLYLSFGTC